jgi:hypothetical protein
MSTNELKLQIFRQVDTLDSSKLKEFYGLMVNYINSKKETSDWIDVSDVEKQGIEEAIVELNEGKALPHEHVIEKMKSKFSYV